MTDYMPPETGMPPQEPPMPPPPPFEDKASGMAIAALVCGILGLVCCGLFAGIPALVCGWIENRKIEDGKSSPRGKGFAIAGMIMGGVSILFTCLMLIVYAIYGAALFGGLLSGLQ